LIIRASYEETKADIVLRIEWVHLGLQAVEDFGFSEAKKRHPIRRAGYVVQLLI